MAEKMEHTSTFVVTNKEWRKMSTTRLLKLLKKKVAMTREAAEAHLNEYAKARAIPT